MTEPIASAAPASYPSYDPEIGDYTTYQPLAKTKWAKDGSGEEGLTFADLLDAINPLQHLPIIAHIYRAITGDQIGLAAKLVGDALYGGPVGLLASGVTAVFEGGAGKSTGEIIAEVAHDIFGPSQPEGGDVKPATQEAHAQNSEQAHESDLAALTQLAMAPGLPVSQPAAATPAVAERIAAAPASMRAPTAIRGNDEASLRIAKSIAEARRAQEGLLLASVQQGEPKPSTERKERAERPADPKADTVAKPVDNPYLPPERPAAAANWSNETLAETIARYERAVAANRR